MSEDTTLNPQSRMINLIIKGNRAIAEHETARRNLDFHFNWEIEKNNETVGQVPYSETNWKIISEWYNSDIGKNPPYLDGSLLHYRII